ncbi:magnesium/cobalt transporter CorA [Flexistipes sp.]|uniref:magnesium/cobalt transporter CorA n=1 Tax=Flexistipes sp. TaxID=3088135 RepID=UPI002E203586|nr:magnesium/cobalt transporter CorA [Flexistipes sp.]
MARFLKKKDKTIGKVPGEPVFIGVKKVDQATINVIDYNDTEISETSNVEAEYLKTLKEKNTVSWININGLHDIELIKEIAETFDLHPVVAEDIANTDQRPKMEDHEEYIFITTKMMRFDEDNTKILNEQVSIIFGKNFLITFQECPGDTFDPVGNRIRKKRGRISGANTDYLAYALMDSIIDKYLVITEKIGEKIEDLEDLVLDSTDSQTPYDIKNYKREIIFLKKAFKPTKEFILQLNNMESGLIDEKTFPFLKDLMDLSTQAVESVETYRDLLSDQLNLYNTNVGNKLNEIMKVLTIFSVIFIPLTFVAGIYGTNFEYLPELKYRYSYFIFWGVLILIAVVMLKFFKNKKWI